jgi:hypothetical protein
MTNSSTATGKSTSSSNGTTLDGAQPDDNISWTSGSWTGTHDNKITKTKLAEVTFMTANNSIYNEGEPFTYRDAQTPVSTGKNAIRFVPKHRITKIRRNLMSFIVSSF